ncbi:hypothetical protein E0W68_03835 [Flavobacterium salilacus subsp. salilacus]|uniref:hypothetical protein n=1 Tax=Flavobacterium TaxID=237 RepID=UPI001074C7A5|nr:MULTISPECIES: hypothetical protein [Flavobacterium]KAF2519488.1 hypothetical protein E0W68_03835 [Flavobacterium salilacus subsp. salilacus]MBE1614615.1 hypothetical protein [Flavobacterium sp. SaA2.13]
MIKNAVLFLSVLVFSSCDSFKEEQKPEAVARVNNSYLYPDDIKGIVPDGTSKEDSIAIVNSFINRWASQKLLYNAAEVNLSEDKQKEYDNLVNQYKIDLYTKAYIEELVKRSVDTLVTDADIKAYYDLHKDNFRTTETLVRLKYIKLDKNHPKFNNIRTKFLSNNKKDIKALNDISIQFKSFAFNDSTWVNMNQVYTKLPFITPDNRDKYIDNAISYQYPDSTDVYMVKVVKVLGKNSISPYGYIKPTLQQLIINSRKLELIKKLEKEITDDAIKNNKYEIYK